MITTTQQATKRPSKAQLDREDLITRLQERIEVYAHGYCTVPNRAMTNRHVVHVDANYFPDYCSCDNHVKFGGLRCVHKLAAERHFEYRRRQLLEYPEPVYHYMDQDAHRRGAWDRLTFGRFDQLTLDERRAAYDDEFDPKGFHLL